MGYNDAVRVECTAEQIADHARILDKRGAYVNAQVGEMRVRYFTLPQSHNPRWKNFVVPYIARDPETHEITSDLYVVSDSIPRHLRDYWVLYEALKNRRVESDEHKSVSAEFMVLDILPDELVYEYVTGRRDHFSKLAIRSWKSPSKFEDGDFIDAAKLRDLHKFLASIKDPVSLTEVGEKMKETARFIHPVLG